MTDAFAGASVAIHCAAETAGGWPEHQANSIDASANALRAAAAAGARRFIHVSSMAVLSSAGGRERLSEATPLHPKPREAGPYVWGKLESEKLVLRLGRELGVAVKIVRPGALIDYAKYEPPGRLGRRVGNVFIAVGAPGDHIAAVDVEFAARTLVWMTKHFGEAPQLLNLVAPVLPTRRELVHELRRRNPDVRVIWLPTVAVQVLSSLGIALQRLLRPRKPAMNVARAFASPRIDTAGIQTVAQSMTRASLRAVELRQRIAACVGALPRPILHCLTGGKQGEQGPGLSHNPTKASIARQTMLRHIAVGPCVCYGIWSSPHIQTVRLQCELTRLWHSPVREPFVYRVSCVLAKPISK